MALEFADSNRGRVTYTREPGESYGEPIANFVGKIVRLTSSSLVANKGTAVSEELRSDSMVSDLIETDFSTGGDLGCEWILGGTWEDFLQSALRSTFGDTTTYTAGTTLTCDSNDLTYVASNPIFINTVPGDFIYVQGFTAEANNGWKQVNLVNSTTSVRVIATPGSLTDESGAVQPEGVMKTVFNGVEKHSYNMEQFFPDLSTAGISQLFLGQRVGTWSLNISAGSIVTGTWGFQGTEVTAKEGTYATSEPGPADDDPVIGATADVANITVDNEAVPCRVQSITLNLDNGLRIQNSIGSKFPCGIGYGRQTITGNITVYFQSLTDYTDFLDHKDVQIWWDFDDALGNHMRVKLPRVKYATGSPMLEGIDTDVMVSLDFQALASETSYGGDPRQIEVATYSVAASVV